MVSRRNTSLLVQVLIIFLAVNGQMAFIIDCKYFNLELDICLKGSLELALKCNRDNFPSNPMASCLPSFFSKYIQCLPSGPKNSTIKFPCSPYYFEKGEAEIQCYPNGTLDNKFLDLEAFCKPLPKDLQTIRLEELFIEQNITNGQRNRFLAERKAHRERVDKIAKTLRFIDLFVCVAGSVILFILIPLKRERIMLHRMLLLAFACYDLVVIIILYLYPSERNGDPTVGIVNIDVQNENKICGYIALLRDYFLLSVICWMFNEGFFQFRQFFFVFLEKAYLWGYFISGWVFPAIVVFVIYLPVLVNHPPYKKAATCWIYTTYHDNNWFIVTGPLLIILFINMCIMTYLMWIIWSKLKTGIPGELKNAKKSARGFIVILVLLGGGYIFTIYGPDQCPEFDYFRATVLPLQGLLVCVFHVFLSREVMDAVTKKIRVFSEADKIRSTATTSVSRRVSAFKRYSSRNASVVSISSNESKSRRNSRKESPGTYPSLDEIMSNNQNIILQDDDTTTSQVANSSDIAVITPEFAEMNRPVDFTKYYDGGDSSTVSPENPFPTLTGKQTYTAEIIKMNTAEDVNNKQLFNVPEPN